MKELHLAYTGPAPRFDVQFAERLNLFTGDNGLGKTFLLDVVWWLLTKTWTTAPAMPQRGAPEEPMISGLVTDETINASKREYTSRFDWSQQQWPLPIEWPPLSRLVIYARIDGGFSVWDPARNLSGGGFAVPMSIPMGTTLRLPQPYHFGSDTLWNGLAEDSRVLCNGLIRDWVTWQYLPEAEATTSFGALRRALEVLSPPGESLVPGKPMRVSVDDARDIPTLSLPYGTVPVTLASAGMQRILGLAYLLVWTWYEHVQASRLLNQPATRHLTLLLDEAEAHLHPAWQRTIIPSVLEVARALDAPIDIQVILTTHSPLVLASAEPGFDEAHDKLFLFELVDREVVLREMPWAKQGDAVGWLTSDIFGLKQARSREAETAIEAAEAYMRGDMQYLPQELQTEEQIHVALLRVLPGDDPFWPRWIVKWEGLAR